MHEASFWNSEAVECYKLATIASQTDANCYDGSMVKFISRISGEVLTCYILSLESISSVVFELWASKAVNMLHAMAQLE